MALNYVSLTVDAGDGSGAFLLGGFAQFFPTALLSAPGTELVTQVPVTAFFRTGSPPVVRLLATDSAGVTPGGWNWTVTFGGMVSPPAPYTFALPFSGGASQNLSSVTVTLPSQSFSAFLPVPSGTPASGQVPVATGSGEASAWGSVAVNPMTTQGDTIYGGASGAMTRLAGDTSNIRKFLRELSAGGVAAAPAWDTVQPGDLPAATSGAQGAVQLAGDLGGTSASPQVTGTHLASALPVAQGGTGQVTQQAAIDALTGTQAAGKFVRSDGTHATLSAIQAGDVPDLAYVDSVAAGDSSVSVTGPADAPVITTGTLDAIAAAHPPAANWGNNGKKITGVANGTAATDAAAFGQIPSLPLAVASGGTGRTTAPAAPVSFAPSNPSATSSTTEVMMGLGGVMTYTPASTGKVLAVLSWYATTATGLVTITAGGRFGTGTAPANGVAVTGTQFGPAADPQIRAPAVGLNGGMSLTAVLSLAAGTTYWFDLALATGNASDAASVSFVSMSLVETA